MESHRIAELHRVLAQVRPYVEGDGGDLEVVSVSEDGEVAIRLTGNCTGCGSVDQTVGGVIAPVLQGQLSWVRRVVAVMDEQAAGPSYSAIPQSCTASLMDEHDRASGLMGDLEAGLLEVRAGQPLPEVVDRWIRHARGALRRHFELEESCVFPAFEMMFGGGGPLATLADDHRSFWPLQGTFEAAVATYRASPTGPALAGVLAASQLMIRHLTVHFLREEGGLFNMLDESLPPELVKELVSDIHLHRQRTIAEFAA